jgi:hypothetical protein
MTHPWKLDHVGSRPQQQLVEDVRRCHGIVEGPQEAERLGPVPHRTVPTFGVLHALVEIRAQQMCDPVATVVFQQFPLCRRLFVGQRMAGAEQLREALGEHPAVGQSGGERPEWTAKQVLDRPKAGAFEDDASICQHRALQIKGQAPLDVSREQLGGYRRPHVVCDEHHWARRSGPDRPARAASSGAAAVCRTGRSQGSPSWPRPVRRGAGPPCGSRTNSTGSRAATTSWARCLARTGPTPSRRPS